MKILPGTVKLWEVGFFYFQYKIRFNELICAK